LSGSANGRNGFPELPILHSVPPPPRTERDKYGGLLYLGAGGLAVLIVFITWFGYRVWQLRDVWAQVYALHDPTRSDAARIDSAMTLSRDKRVADHQLMEICLRRDLPDRARYVLAEAVSTEAVARDPRAFALTVAMSPDWPDWLRLVLARRLAYGAGRGYAIPESALDELAKHSDPMIRIWANYALAVLPGVKSEAGARLVEAARAPDDSRKLAAMLLAARDGPASEREHRLDEATIWMREHHPQAAKIWGKAGG
jgi:hypothetical protein